jgi:hypothetical protein
MQIRLLLPMVQIDAVRAKSATSARLPSRKCCAMLQNSALAVL